MRTIHGGRGDVKPLSQECKDALALLEKHGSFDIEQGDHQALKASFDTLYNRGLILHRAYKTAGKTYFHYCVDEPLPVFVSRGPRVNYFALGKCRGRAGFAAMQLGEGSGGCELDGSKTRLGGRS